jgi:hypothetical protein
MDPVVRGAVRAHDVRQLQAARSGRDRRLRRRRSGTHGLRRGQLG